MREPNDSASTTEQALSVGGCVASEPFALRVLDDSMLPDFPIGCVVVVDPGATPGDGDFVIASVDGALMLRRLSRREDLWYLECLQPRDAAAIVLSDPLSRVLGRVVQRAGRRRRQHQHL